MPRTLVFVELKRDADLVALHLCNLLSGDGIKATTVNGDRPQRLREEALRAFRSSECPIMVATDVMARGLDIKDLDLVNDVLLLTRLQVINMDLPQEATTYIHRIGRTGRLRQGKAISFFDPSNNRDNVLAKSITEV